MRNKLLYILTIVCTICFDGLSQESHGNGSEYRRIKTLSDSTYLVQEFDRDSAMLFFGTLTSIDPDVRNGRFRFYDKEGRVEVAGFYYEDIPYGKWVYYDETGRISRVLDYKAVLDFLSQSEDENERTTDNALTALNLIDNGDSSDSGCSQTDLKTGDFQGHKDISYQT